MSICRWKHSSCTEYHSSKMAEGLEGLEEDFQRVAINEIPFSAIDKTPFSLCSWNIDGTAEAPARRRVVNSTYDEVLSHCKIVCLQALRFNPGPDGRALPGYFRQLATEEYEEVHAKEGHHDRYNAVFFSKQMFEK